MAIEQILQNLKERELEEIELAKLMSNQIYDSLPLQVRRVAESTGMTEEMVILCCVRATQLNRAVKWYQALEIIQGFYQAKSQLEEEEKRIIE